MKKGFIAAAVIMLLGIIVLVAVVLGCKWGSGDKETDPQTQPFADSQIGITVDSWLKIIEITERDGTLAVVVENVSDIDVEYAQLTVKTKTETLSFNISALLHGTRAILTCNEAAPCNPEEAYTLWEIKNKLVFENPPSMHSDKIEATVTKGSISLKNISGEDISSEIYIYYKEKSNDLLNGSATGRFSISGLKADSQTFVKADKLNENNCQIIFIAYDDTEI